MKIEKLPLSKLNTNPRNDRHGELLDEDTAIEWLLSNRSAHMRNLAQDIVKEGQIYELPLVHKEDGAFTVYDGNRRITCLKLLADPSRAPFKEWKAYFKKLRKEWTGEFLQKIECQVEIDRDRVDEILYRRHTGGQSGVGQNQWDAEAKSNFVKRTGKKTKLNVAEEIEKKLKETGDLEQEVRIPRSNLNRLLSAETFRNRVGLTRSLNHLEFTHEEEKVFSALSRIISDMVSKKITLDDIWDNKGKKKYLDDLSVSGALPSPEDSLPENKSFKSSQTVKTKKKKKQKAKPSARKTLIRSDIDYGVLPQPKTQRAIDIWVELQYHLKFDQHNNAISVLFRVLIDLAVNHYADSNPLAKVHANDSLAKKVHKVAGHMRKGGLINKDYLESISKIRNSEQIFSANTLNKYVHSKKFFPSDIHLKSMWDTISEFVVICLAA